MEKDIAHICHHTLSLYPLVQGRVFRAEQRFQSYLILVSVFYCNSSVVFLVLSPLQCSTCTYEHNLIHTYMYIHYICLYTSNKVLVLVGRL